MYISEERYEELVGVVAPSGFELIQAYVINLFCGYYTDFPSEEEFLSWQTDFPECYKNIEYGIALQIQFVDSNGGLNNKSSEGTASISLGRFSKTVKLNDDGNPDTFSNSALVFTDRCCSFHIQLVDERCGYLC